MQWIDGALAKGEQVQFFHDEFRCPIYVKDLVTIILSLTGQWVSGIPVLIPRLLHWLDIWYPACLFFSFLPVIWQNKTAVSQCYSESLIYVM